ncbi:hypothetical protein ABK040_012681 [Willaertia magna]
MTTIEDIIVNHIAPYLFPINKIDINEMILKINSNKVKTRKEGILQYGEYRILFLILNKNIFNKLISKCKTLNLSANFIFGFYHLKILNILKIYKNLEILNFENQVSFDFTKQLNDPKEENILFNTLQNEDIFEICNLLKNLNNLKILNFKNTLFTIKGLNYFINECLPYLVNLEELHLFGNPFIGNTIVNLEEILMEQQLLQHNHHHHHHDHNHHQCSHDHHHLDHHSDHNCNHHHDHHDCNHHHHVESHHHHVNVEENETLQFKFPSLPNLLTLHFENIPLTNDHCQSIINQCQNIKTIIFKNCSLNEEFSIKSNSLQNLDLSANMEYLFFEENKINKTLQNEFLDVTIEYILKDCKNLNNLNIAMSCLQLDEELPNLEKLKYLNIAGCGVTDLFLENLKFTNLEYLDISFNDEIKIVNLKNLKSLQNLKVIDCNSLQNILVNNLIELDISMCPNLDFNFCNELKNLKNLKIRNSQKPLQLNLNLQNLEILDLKRSNILNLELNTPKLLKLEISDVILENLNPIVKLNILKNCKLLQNRNELTTLTFVTKININDLQFNNLFKNCKDFILKIDAQNCNNLQNPNIESDLIEVLDFSNCNNLQNPNLKLKNLKEIYFTLCNKLNYNILQNLINNCNNLQKIILNSCQNINEIKIPSNLKHLNNLDISYCKNLQKLFISYNLLNSNQLKRGIHLFNCNELKEIIITDIPLKSTVDFKNKLFESLTLTSES